LLKYKNGGLQPIHQLSKPPVEEHVVLKYWSYDFVQNSGPAFPLLLWFFAYFFYLVFSEQYDPLKSKFFME